MGCKAWDSVVMARSGVFRDMGLNRTLLGITASFSSLPMASVYASIFAALSTMIAVFNEDYGQHIRVPLASALMEALVHNSIQLPLDDRYRSRRAIRIRSGNYPVDEQTLSNLLDPFFCKYMCADDRTVYLVCPAHYRHQMNAIDCLGITPEIERIIPRVAPYDDTEHRFGIGSGRLDDCCDEVRQIMQNAFLTRSSFDWERIMGRKGIPIVVHRTTQEWMNSQHAVMSGLVTTSGIGPLTWNEGASHECTPCHRRNMSEIRVLDLSNVIAGPTIGRMLARFGAQVTKIDPVRPMYAPDITVVYGIVVNIGKESILLDIKSRRGRNMLNKLIMDADVIIMNGTNTCIERLDLTQDQLRALNPSIILMRFDAWGGPNESGCMQEYIGYDDNVQAGIGIMERFGGDIQRAEEHAHVGTIDVIAGVAAAFSVMNSLYVRKQHNKIVHPRTSLAATGQYLQYPHMFTSYPCVGYGVSCRGIHSLHRLYEVHDTWILVADTMFPCGRDVDIERMMLGTVNATQVCERIISELNISACLITSLNTVVNTNMVPHFLIYGGSFQFNTTYHAELGQIRIVCPCAMRMRGIRHTGHEIAPKYGQHSYKVLKAHNETLLILHGDSCIGWTNTYIPFCSRCESCGKQNGVVSLNCNHDVCCSCLQCSVPNRCPVCKIPHTLDRNTLITASKKMRESYSKWRMGHMHGSKDAQQIFRPLMYIRRVQSEPELQKTSFHFTSAASTGMLSTIVSNGLNA